MSTEVEKLRAFAQAVFGDWPDGGGCDAFELQEFAEQHGLLQGVQVSEPCGEECWCAAEVGRDEFPLVCYRKTPLLTGKPAIPPIVSIHPRQK